MNKKTIISTIIEKYLRRECNLEELSEALKILSDPCYLPITKHVLACYWDKYASMESTVILPALKREEILHNLHLRINLHKYDLFLN